MYTASEKGFWISAFMFGSVPPITYLIQPPQRQQIIIERTLADMIFTEKDGCTFHSEPDYLSYNKCPFDKMPNNYYKLETEGQICLFVSLFCVCATSADSHELPAVKVKTDLCGE